MPAMGGTRLTNKRMSMNKTTKMTGVVIIVSVDVKLQRSGVHSPATTAS
jgi:hypothetical protein